MIRDEYKEIEEKKVAKKSSIRDEYTTKSKTEKVSFKEFLQVYKWTIWNLSTQSLVAYPPE